MSDVADELLMPGPLRKIHFDLTDRCNLRCVYCSVSNERYDGIDMPLALVHQSIALVSDLNKVYPDLIVYINGHGETTFREDWTSLIRPLFESGVVVRLQSNFAKEFSEEELETLSAMRAIKISIDAADRALLRKLRRHVDVRQIITNIYAVRLTARRLLRKAPEFSFSCGLYDKSAPHVVELARLAVELGIEIVEFWNLHEHEDLSGSVPDAELVHPLHSLSDADLRPRIKEILSATKFLRSHGIKAHIQGDFVDKLAARVGMNG